MNTPPNWARSKARRLREIYRQGGLGGLQASMVRLLRRPRREWSAELEWTLRRWREESRWNRLRRKSRDGYLEANMDSGRLVVDASDPGISKELLLYGVHEPKATEFVKGFLQPGMVVVDIGANIGYYVLLEALLVGEGGGVVAIEPAPANLALLKRNITLNALTNVTVIEGAIGDRDGSGTLYLARKSNRHSMLSSWRTQAGSIEVPRYTIDSLVERLRLPRLDLIRMDIEGYEVAAIKGMIQTLKRYKPRLLMDLHPWYGKERIGEVLRVLKDLGFESRHLYPAGLDNTWSVRKGWTRLEFPSIDKIISNLRAGNTKSTFTAFFDACDG